MIDKVTSEFQKQDQTEKWLAEKIRALEEAQDNPDLMKTLLAGVMEAPGYILKESVINCFRLSGSKILLLMKNHGIVYDRDYHALKTISFEN